VQICRQDVRNVVLCHRGEDTKPASVSYRCSNMPVNPDDASKLWFADSREG
jgi:hypothetical protein